MQTHLSGIVRKMILNLDDTNKKKAIQLRIAFLSIILRVNYKSKRSKFITLVQASIKSFTNFSSASSVPYTSAMARSSVLEPNIKSALVASNFLSPVLRSLPSKIVSSSVAVSYTHLTLPTICSV